jgi:hypothetical protein
MSAIPAAIDALTTSRDHRAAYCHQVSVGDPSFASADDQATRRPRGEVGVPEAGE